jgi:hypothetical protein
VFSVPSVVRMHVKIYMPSTVYTVVVPAVKEKSGNFSRMFYTRTCEVWYHHLMACAGAGGK